MLGLIRPILFRRRRSEQVDSDDGGGELIRAVMKARVARGNSAESLTLFILMFGGKKHRGRQKLLFNISQEGGSDTMLEILKDCIVFLE